MVTKLSILKDKNKGIKSILSDIQRATTLIPFFLNRIGSVMIPLALSPSISLISLKFIARVTIITMPILKKTGKVSIFLSIDTKKNPAKTVVSDAIPIKNEGIIGNLLSLNGGVEYIYEQKIYTRDIKNG